MEPQAPAPLPTPEQQSRRPHGLGTLLYVPVLYGVGWLTARPLQWLAPGLRPDQLDLAGLVVALLLLLFSLPWRLRRSGSIRRWPARRWRGRSPCCPPWSGSTRPAPTQSPWSPRPRDLEAPRSRGADGVP